MNTVLETHSLLTDFESTFLSRASALKLLRYNVSFFWTNRFRELILALILRRQIAVRKGERKFNAELKELKFIYL